MADQPDAIKDRRRIAAALVQLRALGPACGPRIVLETVIAPLLAALNLGPPHDVTAAGDALAATLMQEEEAAREGQMEREASAERNRSTVALVVTPWGARFERYWRVCVTEARGRRARWCLTSNGCGIRVVDATRLYSRRFAEFDLVATLDDAALTVAFRRVVGAAAVFSSSDDSRSLHALVASSEQYAASVCRSLRDGVLMASEQVLGALMARQRLLDQATVADTFEQALTIVYRILFLLFAEARNLVPLWHRLYRESYSIESLRESAERSSDAPGWWDTLRAIARLAHSGCHAGDLNVTAFNGRLFSPSRTPLAERRGLDDRAARLAVLALSTRMASDRAGRERILYAELGVEQLGAVYETLLDYQPLVCPERGQRHGKPRVTLEPGSGVRKETGTFYTPQAIADYVVRRTLAPLVKDADPHEILPLRVLDPSMGSGAFLVAACRYLASAYEDALITRGRCHPSDLDEAERASIRRLIAERCLYGVDVNPMAVQLARLSLWLATLAGDRPLSFLDHRLVVGDSLMGAWLTSLRRPPLNIRRSSAAATLPFFDERLASAAIRDALPVRFSLESTPNDTLEQVRAKERALAALSSDTSHLSRWKRVANLWCAAWFDDGALAKAFDALSDAALTGACALPARAASGYLARAEAIASTHRFIHWELEFPEVFFDEHGHRLDRPGFDAIIGNPPWDMMRADARSGAAPSSLVSPVSTAVRFTRHSGVYTAQSDGHANRYQLFVERAIALARAGGRFGLVLPSGFASDAGNAPLRRMLFSRCDVDAIVGVDNRRRIFPIHRSVRFLLLTATAGWPTQRFACRFGIDDAEEIQALDHTSSSGFPIHLSCNALERLSGQSLAIPYVRQAIDIAILEKATSLFPRLADARGWNARFGRELNATDDRDAFRWGTRGLPIVDGKHIEPFHVALDRSTRSIGVADARQLLPQRNFGRPRLGYRDVASATNRTTLIAAILPAGCVSTHTVFCLKTPCAMLDQQLLCGLFNSLVVNYLVRLRVSTHVTTAIVEHLPIATRDTAPRTCREIAGLARILSRRADVDAFAALNARVAALYQLTHDEFAHVLSSFPLVESEVRERALRMFVQARY